MTVGPSPTERAAAEVGVAEDPLEFQHPVLQRLRSGGSNDAGVRNAAVWATGARLASQILIFFGTLITARLLDPSDFGKVAIIFPITTFATIFTNLGLGSAVIHARRVTEELLSTAFWLNAAGAGALTVVVLALSVPLSILYREPMLVPLLCLASLMFGLNLAIAHTALLERTLRFKEIAYLETVATVLNIAVTVVTAAAGMGAYSLVLGPVAYTASLTLLTWAVVRWRPHARPTRASTRELWTFSRGYTGFNIVNFWSRNADNLLLARFVSQTEMGFYNRAYNLMRLPVLQMGVVMNRVMFPALTRMRDDPRRLGEAWIRTLAVASALMAPIAVGMAVAAPAMTEVLYGKPWLGMVPVLELLALSALPQILTTTVGGLLRSTGATDLLFRIGVITSALSLAAIGIGLPWGTVGVATALLVKFYVEVLISIPPCLKQTHLKAAALVRALRGVFLACIALTAVGLAIRLFLPHEVPAWQVLGLQVAACGCTYLGVLFVTDRRVLALASTMMSRGRAATPRSPEGNPG